MVTSMGTGTRLRVALDARIPANRWGGVQQVVQGLASGFAELEPDVDLAFIVNREASEWLAPLLGSGARLVIADSGFGRTPVRRIFDAIRDRSPRAARAVARASGVAPRAAMQLPRSNGYLESLGADVVHFLVPQAVLTELPSIYQPHDLQHVHWPELFEPGQVLYRDLAYRAFCARATFVSVMTQWGRQDLLRSFGLAPEKVAVIPWAPVTGSKVRSENVQPTVALPERFILYPAQTWPHKNHVRLLEAMAILRDRGLNVNLVSTGHRNERFSELMQLVERLGLKEHVAFLGYVDETMMEALFTRASALVYPSLFEGWGLPVVEAFQHGLPVAAANATVLPEVAAGAALLFDPLDSISIADGIARVLQDDDLRADLVRHGHARAAELSWTKSAATFVALYKRVAGRALTGSEQELLAPPTLPEATA